MYNDENEVESFRISRRKSAVVFGNLRKSSVVFGNLLVLKCLKLNCFM